MPALYSSSNSRLHMFFRLANCWVLLETMNSLLSVLMEPKGFWSQMAFQYHPRMCTPSLSLISIRKLCSNSCYPSFRLEGHYICSSVSLTLQWRKSWFLLCTLSHKNFWFSLVSYSNWQVKAHKDLAHFETAYVVKLHSVAKLAPSQSVSLSVSLGSFNSL